MFERVLNNTNSYFDESHSPNINTSTESIDLMQNTNPLFNNPLTSTYNQVTKNKDI